MSTQTYLLRSCLSFSLMSLLACTQPPSNQSPAFAPVQNQVPFTQLPGSDANMNSTQAQAQTSQAPILASPIQSSPRSSASPINAAGTSEVPVASTRPTFPANLPIGSLPANLPVQAPYSPPGAAGTGDFRLQDRFLTDQDTFNQWQAVSLTLSGNQLFVGAIDQKSPTKGTVIQMDPSGANWKDIGKSLLATITLGASGYKIGADLRGMAADASGHLTVIESNQQLHQLRAPDYKLTTMQLAFGGARDLVFSNQNYYIASADGIQQINPTDKSVKLFSPVIATGGLTADSANYLYIIVGDKIQKLDPSGQSGELIRGLKQAIDVAVDAEGDIFVLESTQILWFNANGEAKGSIGRSEFSDARAIAIDTIGNLYVADAGLDYTESAVFKFTRTPA